MAKYDSRGSRPRRRWAAHKYRHLHDLFKISTDAAVYVIDLETARRHRNRIVPIVPGGPSRHTLAQLRIGQDKIDGLVLRAERWRPIFLAQFIIKLDHIIERRLAQGGVFGGHTHANPP